MSAFPTAADTDSMSAVAANKQSVLGSLHKKDVTILLAGETGSGKTSLMILLVNLFMGRGPFELVDKEDLAKEFGLSQTETEIDGGMLYSVTTLDSTKIHIIDTPSLNVPDQDTIYRAFRTSLPSIDVILIVANGTIEHMGIETTHTLSVITTMLPSTLVKNIGFVFTHSDDLSFTFPIDDLQPELKICQRWMIQNPLAIHQTYQEQVDADCPVNVLGALRTRLEDSYGNAVETLKEWLKWLDEHDAQPTKASNDLFQKWEKIYSCFPKPAHTSIITKLRQRQLEGVQFDYENAMKALIPLARSLELLLSLPQVERPETRAHLAQLIALAQPLMQAQPVTPDQMRELMDQSNQALRDLQRLGVPEMELANLGRLEEQGMKAYKTRLEADIIREYIANSESKTSQAEDQIPPLVEEYNEVTISKNLAGHVRSIIQLFESRKKELESGSNPGDELNTVKQNLERWEHRLTMLQRS